MINEANKRKVKSIFSSDQSTIWRIPPYQREYSWEKNKECEELFNDIVEIAEEENDYHFIGSMITYSPEGEDEKQIVDGQQRTVTLSFFYLSLFKYLNELKEIYSTDKYDDEINRIENKFIDTSSEDNKAKFILSSQKRNNLDFKFILDENQLIHLTTNEKKSNQRVRMRKFYQSFTYISTFIRTYIQNEILKEEKKYFDELKETLIEVKETLVKNQEFDKLKQVLTFLSLFDKSYDKENKFYLEYKYNLSDIYNEYRKKKEEKTYPKLDSDDSFFSKLKELNKELDENTLPLTDRYLNLMRMVDKNIIVNEDFKSFFADIEYKVIKKLIQTIDETLIVLIDVKSLRSANNIFETINNRGRALLPMDLLKNKILAYIDDMKDSYLGKRNRIDDQYKIFMDNLDKNVSDHIVMQGTVGTWSAMIEPLSENDQISFLRRYYIAFNDKYEIDYKKPTKNNILEIFERIITKENAINILKDLYEKSLVYRELISNNSKYSNLSYLSVTPAYSLLLYLEVNKNEIEDFTQLQNKVIYTIEKFFVRRHLTNYPTINKLDDLFKRTIDEIKLIDKENFTSINIYQIIVKNITSPEYWATDEMVKELLEGDIYLRHSELTKYLLVHLDKELSTSNDKETNTNYWEKIKKQPLFSVEHILPQQTTGMLDKEWINSILKKDTEYEAIEEEIDFAMSQKDSNCHKLGNLTLTGYNSSLSDKPFKQKRDKQDEKKKYIGFKNGLALNKDIESNENWEVTDIEDRTSKLVSILQNTLFQSSFEIK
ncbi:DUF262 domain-containing protein [Poseidonibacter lekithochrous]|uniref:DUF262 domain-containing protein n=1 Tax=Poseidonibacter lekithochrous TaxID=1904463 RepID=UPI0008FCD1E9|nr:DUF262 domain-containing protein [Poseidonibacter lekithochrous]QKJ23979.1 DUF262 and DUF1524 domain-containing protein [Poseidonibacter lekithochrous]